MPAIVRLNVDMKSSHETSDFGIGEIAERFGLATHVLRHWETMGLLSPTRVNGARRRYGQADLYRVAVILRAKEAGFGLDDIREMFTTHDPSARTKILQHRRNELAQRIAKAQASLDLLDCALACDHDDIATCPHFQQAVTKTLTGEPAG
jgi:DNA-binding transcriptional MerR regulator